jgi:hypothetical protein
MACRILHRFLQPAFLVGADLVGRGAVETLELP